MLLQEAQQRLRVRRSEMQRVRVDRVILAERNNPTKPGWVRDAGRRRPQHH